MKGLKAGLPMRLQDQAMLVTDDFDTVVSNASRLSCVEQVSARERVREVQTHPVDNSVQRPKNAEYEQSKIKCYYCQKTNNMTRHCRQKKLDMERSLPAMHSIGELKGSQKLPARN